MVLRILQQQIAKILNAVLGLDLSFFPVFVMYLFSNLVAFCGFFESLLQTNESFR